MVGFPGKPHLSIQLVNRVRFQSQQSTYTWWGVSVLGGASPERPVVTYFPLTSLWDEEPHQSWKGSSPRQWSCPARTWIRWFVWAVFSPCGSSHQFGKQRSSSTAAVLTDYSLLGQVIVPSLQSCISTNGATGSSLALLLLLLLLHAAAAAASAAASTRQLYGLPGPGTAQCWQEWRVS